MSLYLEHSADSVTSQSFSFTRTCETQTNSKHSMAWVVPESVQVVLSIGVVLIILTLMWMIFAKLMGITSDQGRYRYISRYNNNNDG